ncbi:MAG: HD domain-containing protein [Phycisphaerales bacterium]|nr:HD domain-containing protein [Phycisphaerales bacterium]
MTLALAVYHPLRSGHILLKPSAVLDASALERLREFKVASLWVRYPALDFLARYTNPRLLAQHAELAASLSTGFESATRRAHAPMDYRQYAGAVAALLDAIMEAPQAAIFLHEVTGGAGATGPLMAHSANVCFLSLLLGLKLDTYMLQQRRNVPAHRAKRTESLGLGALLHDVGMLHLAPNVLEHYLNTGDLKDPEVRRHVLLGYEMVRGKIPPTAASVVLHHHQRTDGTGFPQIPRLDGIRRALAGRQIHIFSRIVAVADMFDRLRHPPSARAPGEPPPEPLPAVCALRQLLELARRRVIDPVVFKALCEVAPAYAPGSVVTLNDGRTAVVTAWDAEQPCRPAVRPIIQLNPLQPTESTVGQTLDLRTDITLEIAACDGHPTLESNFYPLTPGAPATDTGPEHEIRTTPRPRSAA